VLVMRPGLTVAELEDLGVRRISIGGGLARVAWASMMSAAALMKTGSFEGLANAASGKELNAIFRGPT
jgi:2-methylisocitrate lyase-like PEP mutase family enzyme